MGVNCILDATFNTEQSREAARKKMTNVVFAEQIYIVECICPEEIVINRLKARKGDNSDVDVENRIQ